MKKKFKRRSYVETPSQTKKREKRESLIKSIFVALIAIFIYGWIAWFIFSWVRLLFF
jgi:multidrug resistance efflux pump